MKDGLENMQAYIDLKQKYINIDQVDKFYEVSLKELNGNTAEALSSSAAEITTHSPVAT